MDVLPLVLFQGLGKTVQTIAFLTHLLEQGVKGPHIIVAPSSTLGRCFFRTFRRVFVCWYYDIRGASHGMFFNYGYLIYLYMV